MFTLALPIAGQGLITQSLNLIDNLMVGQLGELPFAAVGLANQIFFIHHMLLFGITGGCATFFAQYWGARDPENIRRVLGFCFTITVSAGALFFIGGFFFPEILLRLFTTNLDAIALGKVFLRTLSPAFIMLGVTFPFAAALRATEQPALPLKISFIALTINTGLGYCLIFGHLGLPALGIKGAALGTLIARTLELSLMLYAVLLRNNILGGKLRSYFSYTRQLSLRIVKNALPTTINEVMWGLAMAAYAAAYGRLSMSAFAAVTASDTINRLFMVTVYSMGDVSLILVGKELGQGKKEEAYVLASKLLKISGIIGLVAGLLLIACARPILSIFDFTPEGYRYAFLILLIYGGLAWLKAFNGVNIVGTLRGGGDTRYAMLCEVSTMWLVGVPIVWVSALYCNLPVYLVVLLAQWEEVVKCFFLTRRFLSKKWMNVLVHDTKKE